MKRWISLLMVVMLSSVAFAQDYVTFYSECFYRGTAAKLSEGRHSMNGTSIGPAEISAIRIPYGFKVVAYDGTEPGTGQKISFTGDVDCLGYEWDNRIRAVVIERDNSSANTNTSSGYPLTIYGECDYRGPSQGLSAGYHDARQLGIGSRNLSSLQLAEGYGVILYDQQSFRGQQDTWTNSVPCLGDFNNRTASVYVYRTTNSQAGSNTRPANSGAGSYPVTIYADCDYRGASSGLSAGYHDGRQLGIGTRSLSSVKVSDGYGIILYDQAGYRGASDTWDNSVPCLGDFNDRTMSVYVYKKSNSGNNNNSGSSSSGNYDNGVAFFTDCGFSGFSTTLHEGAFSQSQMGIGDNTISSIKVPRGYSVLVFINDNFGGSMKSFTSDVNCLDNNWNDKISSIQISKTSH